MTALAEAPPEILPVRRSVVARLLTDLFPSAQSKHLTRNGVLLGGAAVVVATVVSLFRTSGTGPFQSIWEEDARDILTDSLRLSGVGALVKPVAGYRVVGARMLGEVASLFPLGWAAAVLSITAAIVCALLALQIYVASGAHLNNRFVRFLVAAPMMVAPAAENNVSEIYNRPVCMHFFAMYALFWLLLWSPSGRLARAGLITSVALTGLSTILIVFYVPLAIARFAVRRDRLSGLILGVVLLGAVVQASGNFGYRGDTMRFDPIWAVGMLLAWAVPNATLGFQATNSLAGFELGFQPTLGDHLVPIIAGWLVVVVVVTVGLIGARRGFLRPKWALAVVSGVYGALLLMGMIMANGQIAQRYVFPFELLLFASLTLMLLPAEGIDRRKAGAALAAFALFVGVISATNYRWDNTYRHNAPRWTDQVGIARSLCSKNPQLSQVIVRGAPRPWWSIVTIPCNVFRPQPCASPGCVWLDPPQSLPRRETMVP